MRMDKQDTSQQNETRRNERAGTFLIQKHSSKVNEEFLTPKHVRRHATLWYGTGVSLHRAATLLPAFTAQKGYCLKGWLPPPVKRK